MRKAENRERKSAMVVATAIGIGAGYVSSLSRAGAVAGSNGVGTSSSHDSFVRGSKSDTKRAGNATTDILSLLRSVSIMAISTSASYWYLRCLRNEIRRRREERDARDFFSRKSASGNKY